MKINGPEMTDAIKNASGINSAINKTQKGSGFGDMLIDAIDSVNKDIIRAQDLAALSAAGQPVDTTEVMISAAKADISFNLFVALRNKVISAYEEVMKMQF
ncbi:MAG: flagellar hook-basal body complex protein FliE [Dissulfurimicrobium sp.]|uniref:flagellar hook-basal body complex protein FliE n=1 Tax=Dissulfurimicrobium sp. TaxID=2022436 RepID=UPI00404997E4